MENYEGRKSLFGGEGREELVGKEEKESNTIEIAHFGELDLEETIIQQLCCLDPIVRRQPWLLPPSDKRNKEKKKNPHCKKTMLVLQAEQ